uniref:Uncharacterized protein n=1 Tax=Arundo donax TaxID=35708 RepID=A0A0A8Z2S1_ARUDO
MKMRHQSVIPPIKQLEGRNVCWFLMGLCLLNFVCILLIGD